ncbi:MAG: hypothetical protein K2M04_08040 [Muribaculaceae bacterium]|nr:hypothetical protein [Muribaculaceae bacterium]
MYFEFLYIPLDYLSTLSRKERLFEIILPMLLAGGSCFCEIRGMNIQLNYIEKFIPCAEILLGFILTALSVLVTSDKFKVLVNNYPSGKTIRNVPVSLYRVLITEFSFAILTAALIIVTYFIAKAIPLDVPWFFALIANGLFISVSFSLLFSTIRVVTNLYFMQSKT